MGYTQYKFKWEYTHVYFERTPDEVATTLGRFPCSNYKKKVIYPAGQKLN